MIKNLTNQFKKNERIIHIGFMLMLTLIPISLCFNNSVWLDEGFSLRWSTLPFGKMMGRLINDVHPPLYYFMLRAVLFLTGKSLLAAKFLSVLGVFLLLLTGYLFVKKEFGRKAMYFYWFFILFTPMMLKKAVEVRMYTWSYLFVLLSAVEMYYLLSAPTKKHWIRFTLFSLCAAYTQYFALLTMIFVYAAVVVYFVFSKNWREVRNWFLCCIATIVLYLPWLPIVLKQMQGDAASWITKPTSRLGLVRELFISDIPGSQPIYLFIVMFMLLFAFVLFVRKADARNYWRLACMAPLWGCLIFGLVYGELFKPILISRYLMIPLTIVILGCSSLCRYIPKIIVAIICIFFLMVGIVTYRQVYIEEYRTLTEETLAFAKENIEESDLIVTDAGSLSSVIPYYFPTVGSVNDVYKDDYDSLWYFDNSSSLDIEELHELGIECENYGQYGLDNVYFTIYELTKN